MKIKHLAVRRLHLQLIHYIRINPEEILHWNKTIHLQVYRNLLYISHRDHYLLIFRLLYHYWFELHFAAKEHPSEWNAPCKYFLNRYIIYSEFIASLSQELPLHCYFSEYIPPLKEKWKYSHSDESPPEQSIPVSPDALLPAEYSRTSPERYKAQIFIKQWPR